jgi:maleate isomerase
MTTHPQDVFVRTPRFIGVITPSGNTVVERVTQAIMSHFPGVTPLFSRTPVFGESDPLPDRYGVDDMLAAAQLLAHAKPDVLLWNGSKGAKIGIAHDRDFVALVQAETSIRTTTSILAMDEVLRSRGAKRVAIVSPYDSHYQEGLVAGVRAMGYEVVAERHVELKDNISFAAIPADTIAAMVRDAVAARPDAVLTLCTNFPAAPVIPALEAETGIPMFDSVSIGVWHALRLMGVDTSPARDWGRLFAEQGRE